MTDYWASHSAQKEFEDGKLLIDTAKAAGVKVSPHLYYRLIEQDCSSASETLCLRRFRHALLSLSFLNLAALRLVGPAGGVRH